MIITIMSKVLQTYHCSTCVWVFDLAPSTREVNLMPLLYHAFLGVDVLVADKPKALGLLSDGVSLHL